MGSGTIKEKIIIAALDNNKSWHPEKTNGELLTCNDNRITPDEIKNISSELH